MKKIYSDSQHNILIPWLFWSVFVTFIALPYILTSQNLANTVEQWIFLECIIFILVIVNDFVSGEKEILLMTNTFQNKLNKLVIGMKIEINHIININDDLFHVYLEVKEFSYHVIFDIEYVENKESKYIEFYFSMPEELISNFDTYSWQLTISKKDEDIDIYYKFSDIQFDSEVQEKVSSALKKSINSAMSIENRYRTLNLSFKKLKSVPLKVLEDVYITELNLSHNEISTLPDFLQELKYLKKINLENNHIREIPSFFEKYKYLEEIYLDNNYIKRLDLKFNNMSVLTFFSVNNNSKLGYIDESVFASHLKFRLGVRNTRLEKSIKPIDLIIKRKTKINNNRIKGGKNEKNINNHSTANKPTNSKNANHKQR